MIDTVNPSNFPHKPTLLGAIKVYADGWTDRLTGKQIYFSYLDILGQFRSSRQTGGQACRTDRQVQIHSCAGVIPPPHCARSFRGHCHGQKH